jgi:hypothetical protein
MRPVVSVGSTPLTALAEGFENYYALLNFTMSTINLTYDITMQPAALNYPFQTGPFTQQNPPIRPAGQDYWISTKDINVQVRQNTFFQQTISMYNFKNVPMGVAFSLPDSVKDFIQISQNSVSISPSAFSAVNLIIYGTRPLGDYNTSLALTGDIQANIPIHVKVVPNNFPIQALLSQIDLLSKTVSPGDNLTYRLTLQNLLTNNNYQILMNTTVKDLNGNVVTSKESQTEISSSMTIIDGLKIPDNTPEGPYTLDINMQYLGYSTDVVAPFQVSKPIYAYAVFGIPLWIYFILIAFVSFIFLNTFLYRVYKRKKQRYKIQMDYGTLPQAGERTVKLGLIA